MAQILPNIVLDPLNSYLFNNPHISIFLTLLYAVLVSIAFLSVLVE